MDWVVFDMSVKVQLTWPIGRIPLGVITVDWVTAISPMVTSVGSTPISEVL
jgi:hypothetical protein